MTEDEETFRLHAAITHAMSRLRGTGWLALRDQERDSYIYVGTARELGVPLLAMMRKLGEVASLCLFLDVTLGWQTASFDERRASPAAMMPGRDTVRRQNVLWCSCGRMSLKI